jgi:hypothetical protein
LIEITNKKLVVPNRNEIFLNYKCIAKKINRNNIFIRKILRCVSMINNGFLYSSSCMLTKSFP